MLLMSDSFCRRLILYSIPGRMVFPLPLTATGLGDPPLQAPGFRSNVRLGVFFKCPLLRQHRRNILRHAMLLHQQSDDAHMPTELQC